VVLTYPEETSAAPASRVSLAETPGARQGDAVRLGVLGAGNFANATLLPAIRRNKATKLVGIASVGGLHAQATAKKFGFAYAASDEDDVLNDPAVNTLAILTRHDSHADLAVKGLQAGKHVFVEKPLAIEADGLKKVQAALKKAPGLLTVGFNRRFAPLAFRLEEFLAGRSEPLYMHYRVNAGYIPLTHWTQDPAQGGGRIVGEGCHFIDFLTFLAGGAPISVNARALPDNGKYRQDNVSMTFTFPDGSLGVVDYLADGDKAFSKERVEIFCGGQVAVLDDFRSLVLVRNGQRKTVRSVLRQDKGHAGEWQAFVEAIRAGGPPPIPYKQLVGVTRASFAAVESLRLGQPVEIT
jgi:predicted dehydrogenase